MTQHQRDARDDFQDTVPFSRDDSPPVGDGLASDRSTDRPAAAASAPAADDRSLRMARIAAVIDLHKGEAQQERPLPRIRRSELRSIRTRQLTRAAIVSAAIIALVLFLHFVALPLSETGSLQLGS